MKHSRSSTENLLLCLSFIVPFLFSCDKTEEESQKANLHFGLKYAEMTGAFEGQEFTSGAPVVSSNTQPIFEIVGGSADIEGAFIENVFQIKDSTGVVKLDADNELPTATYSLDIKVTNEASETVFPSVFKLQILPSTASDLVYVPEMQTIVRGREDNHTNAPAYKGTQGGIFSLVDEERFLIDEETGEISLPVDSQIEMGTYALSVAVTNEAGVKEFPKAIKIIVESLPFELLYTPSVMAEVQMQQGKVSPQPTIKGTNPFIFSLQDAPAGFSIDAETGVVSLEEGHQLEVGDYPLAIAVSNQYGEEIFENALTYSIVPIQLVAPSNLVYSTTEYVVKVGKSFETVVPAILGSTPVTFQLVGAPAEFQMDVNTGVISLVDGHDLPVGTYNLTVQAGNEKEAVDFENALVVTVQGLSEELIFVDAWDEIVYPAPGIHPLGHFTTISLSGDPVQSSTGKWKNTWGVDAVADATGAKAAGMVMLPNKDENEDWLISDQIDLTDASNCRLEFSAYSRYAKEDHYLFEVYVSTNYTGDVATTNWVKLEIQNIENPDTEHIAIDQAIDLSQFDGQHIQIGFKTHVFPLDSDPADYAVKGGTYIRNVEVFGVR